MSIPIQKIAFCGLLIVLTLVSGVWLSHSGKPFNGLIFTVHKLIALATVIFLGVYIYHRTRGLDPNTLVLSSIVVAGLLFLALFVSGALLSIGKPAPAVILKIHQVTPLLALVSSAATMVLLPIGNP
jgi:hypothetical protein